MQIFRASNEREMLQKVLKAREVNTVSSLPIVTLGSHFYLPVTGARRDVDTPLVMNEKKIFGF